MQGTAAQGCTPCDKAAARLRWRHMLEDAGLLDKLVAVLANLELAATSVAPQLAAAAAADATSAIVTRLLGECGPGRQLHRRSTTNTLLGAATAAAFAAGAAAVLPLATTAPSLAALLSKVDRCKVGLLIDLDGTLYSPLGLLPGAILLYERLVANGTPFVLVSNTGAKAAAGVSMKLQTAPFLLPGPPIDPTKHIWTAADAQVQWMVDNLPAHARVFVISGSAQPFWHGMLMKSAPELVRTWVLRTHLTESEAKGWATKATISCATKAVCVALFIDGNIAQNVDPTTGEAGFTDWSFDVVKKASYLLMHGACFVYTADDAFNPSADPEFPDMVWPLPGPGMFAAMMRRVMYPRGADRVFCVGKGGAAGAKHMMGRALEMLVAQGHSGERHNVLMIGDRFDTDVRAGVQACVRTCLVQSGCHLISEQRHFPADVPDYVLGSIKELVGLLPRAFLVCQPVLMRFGGAGWSPSLVGQLVRPSGPSTRWQKALSAVSASAAPASDASFDEGAREGEREADEGSAEVGMEGMEGAWDNESRVQSLISPPFPTRFASGGNLNIASASKLSVCPMANGQLQEPPPLERRALSMPGLSLSMQACAERAPTLQRWMLQHGQHAAAAGAGRLAAGPLFPVLRRHFETHPEVLKTGALSSGGLLDAMAALGLHDNELDSAAASLARDGVECVDFKRFFREIHAPLSSHVGDDVLVGIRPRGASLRDRQRDRQLRLEAELLRTTASGTMQVGARSEFIRRRRKPPMPIPPVASGNGAGGFAILATHMGTAGAGAGSSQWNASLPSASNDPRMLPSAASSRLYGAQVLITIRVRTKLVLILILNTDAKADAEADAEAEADADLSALASLLRRAGQRDSHSGHIPGLALAQTSLCLVASRAQVSRTLDPTLTPNLTSPR
mmetsp:Transcript_14898/g.34694  ORF Transcript_14898/g.34694 Transcript_14898/m.34694 type:complete len:906 (+) Transcript_14898:114-2831(+)